MMRYFLVVMVATTIWCKGVVFAQGGVSYGFKAGLNFSGVKGPEETDDSGNALERYNTSTGFHIGGNVSFRFTDQVGLRTEFMFTQKGYGNFYEGPAQLLYEADSGNKVLFNGNLNSGLSVFNNYLELPVMFYYRPVEKIELSAGASAGVLISSTGSGNLSFSGTAASGITVNYDYELDYNYLSDALGEAVYDPPVFIDAGNELLTLPSVAGAYFLFDNDPGKTFRTLDISLNAGLAFYFNSALYLGGRVNFGMTDITQTAADIRRYQVENANFILSDDRDTYLNLQASIGFNF